MSTYPLGTVAWADIDGVGSYKVMHIGTEDGTAWVHTNLETGEVLTRESRLSNIRPLVVLDPWALGWVNGANIAYCLRSHERAGCNIFDKIADQIEAQTKPPRIPEPGWGERVVARIKGSDNDDYREFVHAYRSASIGTVWTDATGFHAAWSDLIDPSLVRDGIEDES